MKEFKINLSVPCLECENGGMCVASFDSPFDVSGIFYSKDKLRKAIETEISELSEQKKNSKRFLIVTNEGSIILGRFYLGHWGYEFAHNDGKPYSCGGTIGNEDFEKTFQRARDHANQAFGGIAWEKQFNY